MYIIGLVPARSGSKGVSKKNIKPLKGYPLVAYAICASKLTGGISRTIVSTDSLEIADISKKYGAEVPFLRPAEISQDNSTDLELFQHVIEWFSKNEDRIPNLMVHLRPTTPLRDPREIDKAINLAIERSESTSLRSAHELAESPHKVFQIDGSGFLKGFFPDDPRPEYYNLPRQSFPKAYHPNGYVDIIKADFVRRHNSLHGQNMLGFITPLTGEVDRIEDFEFLEYHLGRYSNPVYEYLRKNYPAED